MLNLKATGHMEPCLSKLSCFLQLKSFLALALRFLSESGTFGATFCFLVQLPLDDAQCRVVSDQGGVNMGVSSVNAPVARILLTPVFSFISNFGGLGWKAETLILKLSK